MTFQAWKMVLLNSMTFQEEWSPCKTHTDTNECEAVNTAVSVFDFLPYDGPVSALRFRVSSAGGILFITCETTTTTAGQLVKNCPSINVGPTALTWTHQLDLDIQSPVSYGHDLLSTHTQKFKVYGLT